MTSSFDSKSSSSELMPQVREWICELKEHSDFLRHEKGIVPLSYVREVYTEAGRKDKYFPRKTQAFDPYEVFLMMTALQLMGMTSTRESARFLKTHADQWSAWVEFFGLETEKISRNPSLFYINQLHDRIPKTYLQSMERKAVELEKKATKAREK